MHGWAWNQPTKHIPHIIFFLFYFFPFLLQILKANRSNQTEAQHRDEEEDYEYDMCKMSGNWLSINGAQSMVIYQYDRLNGV